MPQHIDTSWLSEKIKKPTMNEIAIQITELIHSGEISIGAILPSVRDLAHELGISPATVSGSWGILRKHKLITGMGRQGITVSGNKVSMRPLRFAKIGHFGEHIITDLTYAVPDPNLLPDLSSAISHAIKIPTLNSYQREQITPALKKVVSSTWPYQPEGFIAMNGGFEGLYFLLQIIAFPGAIIAVEDPTATRILDILDNLNVTIVPIPCDNEGPDTTKLAAILAKKPAAFIYQPRTHSPCGHSVSQKRFDQFVTLFKATETLIIEDDGIGDLSNHPSMSLGQYYPQQTIHIRSYSKSFGPDLRLAVLSAPCRMIKKIQDCRNFGAGWTSRILQETLAWLLNDEASNQQVVEAKKIYRQRYNALIDALESRGIHLPYGDALCLWLPVPSEQFALITMAARGIAVTPGEHSRIGEGAHIRIATSQLTEHIDLVADAIVLCIKAA